MNIHLFWMKLKVFFWEWSGRVQVFYYQNLRQYTQKLAVLLLIIGGVCPVVFVLAMGGVVSVDWHGFGVDSSGNVYVGASSEITVYRAGECIRTIDIPQYRSYYLTLKDDQIILASTSKVYTMDLAGNVLSSEPDEPGGGLYQDLQWKREFRTTDGENYRANGLLLRHRIERADGTVVYRMPLPDFVARVILMLWGPAVLIAAVKAKRHSRIS